MKGKIINIKDFEKFIYIESNVSGFSKKDLKNMKIFLNEVNMILGAKTNINYKIYPLIEEKEVIKIKIPINNNTNKDIGKDLLHTRIKTIKNILESPNLIDEFSKPVLFITRLLLETTNFINCSRIENEDESLNYPIMYNFKKLPKIETKIIKLNDGSIIKQVIDPVIVDYGIYCDFSKNFTEMGYGYNYLHLYEHIMTYGWEKCDKENVLYYNGFTCPNAVCCIMAVLNNKHDLENYLKSFLKFINKFRKNPNINGLKLETERTISETNNRADLTDFGRSDPLAYDLNYNYEIFRYWANEPMNILLITPEEIKCEMKMETYEVKKPKIKKFDYLPLSVIRSRIDREYGTFKLTDKTSLKNIMYGKDCYLKRYNNESLEDQNSYVLQKILWNNEDIKILPCNSNVLLINN